MLCNNCGTSLKDSDKYCENCGQKINKSQPYNSEEIKKAELFSKVIGKYEVKNIKITNDNIRYESNYHPKKKKRWIPIVSILFVVLFVGVIFFYINKNKILDSDKGTRTIMIYMIGSDLESKYLAGSKDLNEIMESNISYDDFNILVYTGGAKKWHTDEIPNDKQVLFELNENGLVKLEEFELSSDMVDYTNLAYLLEYGYKNYKTDYYDLILWDHGAGPIYGYGYDEYNKYDSMSILELKKALEESPFNGTNKLEFIGFDACLMSSIEIASVLSHYSDYMIASQEFEPGSGWDYSFLGNIDRDSTTEDVGKAIIDSYSNYYEAKKYVKGTTLSLLKLNKVENVEKSLNKLFESIDKNLVIEFSKISRSRSSSKSFGRITDEYYDYDLVDLRDLINNLPEEYNDEKDKVYASLEDLIIYQKTDMNNTNGVSIYFPYENKIDIVSNLKIYKDLNFAYSYYDFISSFSSRLTGKKESNWDITKSKISALEDGKISLTLPSDVASNYSSADYIIFEKNSDGFFTPIFKGNDVALEGNVLSTTVANKSIVVTSKDGGSIYLTAIEALNGKDYVKYNIPITLSKMNVDTFEFDIIGAYIEFIVDEEHKEGYVASIYPMDTNENQTYSKIDINVKDWDVINFLSYKYKILDKNGKYTSNWVDSEEVLNMELLTKDEYKIEFKDLDISYDYYCIFRVKDNKGNIYSSNIVEINN